MRVLHVGYGFRPWRHGGLIFYAEDLMEAQAAGGHEVSYFFSGRRYPVGPRDRLRRWSRRGVAMREVVSSSLRFGGEDGTLTPETDLDHAPSEALFEQVLDELAPEVVHIQELIGLPSSFIDLAGARAIPTVMTLQDYLPLCPVLKLYDVDGRLCLRHDVGAQCARCSAGAPEGDRELVNETIRHDVRRALPEPAARTVLRGIGLAGTASRRLAAVRRDGADGSPDPEPASPAAYQRRRDVNVERLSRLDAAVAQSHRLAEIYAGLGVDASRLRVMQLTLRHIERIAPKTIDDPPSPVRLVTLNGCASVQKGKEVVIGALEQLDRQGLADRFTLTVYGYVTEETLARLRRFPNVDYAGYYEPQELEQTLEPYDVGILPSIWEEAYGYVGVEMLAKGIPVIGNARGGIVDYVRDGETGWLNRECSAEGLARIVSGIVAEPGRVMDLNARIRERRGEILKPFDVHVEEMLDLYRDVTTRWA
jgi:glycosyltransferase involved in cell wall biosynthesis